MTQEHGKSVLVMRASFGWSDSCQPRFVKQLSFFETYVLSSENKSEQVFPLFPSIVGASPSSFDYFKGVISDEPTHLALVDKHFRLAWPLFSSSAFGDPIIQWKAGGRMRGEFFLFGFGNIHVSIEDRA